MPIENLNLWECPNGHKEFEIEVREDCKLNVKCTTCGATKVVPFLMIQYHANPWAIKKENSEGGEEDENDKTELPPHPARGENEKMLGSGRIVREKPE